jgi:hypothetical protein
MQTAGIILGLNSATNRSFFEVIEHFSDWAHIVIRYTPNKSEFVVVAS